LPSKHFLLVIGARAAPGKVTVGAEFASGSVDLATMRGAINGQDGKPIEITPNQWQFLRGVYAMNPEAACGLPRGDNAVFAQDSCDSSGLLFFIDGNQACAPMHAPPALLSLMERVTMDDHQTAL
jgi:hypothetical protein